MKKELAKLRGQGLTITPNNLRIAETCPLILPFHRDLDGLREDASDFKIGTTRRGIGPAYEDKVGRRAIRVCDLVHLDTIDPQIDRLCAHHDAMRSGFGESPIDRDRLKKELEEIAPTILPFARPVWHELKSIRQHGDRILFEGAQGMLLDVDHGTYPFVTSSNTIAGAAAGGSGLDRRRPASSSVSSKPIRPASAQVLSRPNWRTKPAGNWANRAMNSAR